MSDSGQTEMAPTSMRHLVVRGKADNGWGLEAHMYVPAVHVALVTAQHLANGYEVENPEPDTHAVHPALGELYLSPDALLHADTHAHAAELKAAGITDLAAHVASLKIARGASS
jgi:hypothetical protein